MDRKIRVAAVSYLNTKPLVYGFEQGLMKGEIDLIFDYPAVVAQKLINDEADIGLIPVTAISKMKDYCIIGDYCIGALDNVASVCLFSDVPLEKIETILLDYQSHTSVALLKILLKKHWKINPVLKQSSPGYEYDIKGTTAGLIIGDRALMQRNHSTYIYDLAKGWNEMTGLPFVFAAWVANKDLSEKFKTDFNNATATGLQHIDEIVATNIFPEYDLKTYFTKNIDYKLDGKKKEALKLFLEMLKEEAPLPPKGG